MRVLIACESSGRTRDAFIARGHDAMSCDFLPTTQPGPHYQGDCLDVLDGGWDLMIAHPTCTYLTGSAEWAYGDGPYHQKVKPTTLVGKARRDARKEAVEFVLRLRKAPIKNIVIENPVGHLSSVLGKATQTIQPYWFGDDASKKTCLWVTGDLPLLKITNRFPGRIVEYPKGSGKMVERWSNQTDSGQNKLTPSDDRWSVRSATYPGFANAMAEQWGNYAKPIPNDLFTR